MLVYCGDHSCKYNKDDMCDLDILRIDEDGQCSEYRYDDYCNTAPEYQEKYYTSNSRYINGERVFYRAERKGKKYETDGIVAYTSSDTRHGIENAIFTEKRTGIIIPYAEMLHDEALKKKVIDGLPSYPDVMTLPFEEEQ